MEPVREAVPQFVHRAGIRLTGIRLTGIRAGIRRTGIRCAGERPVQQRPQLGPVARVGVIGYPGLRHGPQLSLSRHVHHSFQLVLTRYSQGSLPAENPGFAEDLGGNRGCRIALHDSVSTPNSCP